jgi:DNA-binding transcriptional ArsR family regulator
MSGLLPIDDPQVAELLQHPLRARLLGMLGDETASPSELARTIGVPVPMASYHVRTLRRAGLVELVGETERRGALQHHYRAPGRPVVSDEAWASLPDVAKGGLIRATLEHVRVLVERATACGGFDRPGACRRRMPLYLDDAGWRLASEAMWRALHRLPQIEASARRRSDPPVRRALVVMKLFERGADHPAEGYVRSEAHLTRSTVRVDDVGWGELARLMSDLVHEVRGAARPGGESNATAAFLLGEY